AAVVLLETVHEEDLLPERGVLEVDDHLHPLCRTDLEALHRDGVLQELDVGADRDEGLIVAQEELVEARVRAVQEPEAILPPRHPQERLDGAVQRELVAEEAVVVEGVEDEEAVLVELLVLDDDRDVELPRLLAVRQARHPAREPERARVRVELPRDRVDRVEVEEEPREPSVDFRSGDVDGVVVVPERRVLVLLEAVVRLVRVEEVSGLPGAEGIERVPVVLLELEAAVTMNDGGGL